MLASIFNSAKVYTGPKRTFVRPIASQKSGLTLFHILKGIVHNIL